jgi:hypothetical protein
VTRPFFEDTRPNFDRFPYSMFKLGRNGQTQQARFEVTRLIMDRDNDDDNNNISNVDTSGKKPNANDNAANSIRGADAASAAAGSVGGGGGGGEPRLSHVYVRSTASLDRNVWIHITATYEPTKGELAIFFNGVLQNNFVAPLPGILVGKSGAPLLIARSSTAQERHNFYGSVSFGVLCVRRFVFRAKKKQLTNCNFTLS